MSGRPFKKEEDVFIIEQKIANVTSPDIVKKLKSKFKRRSTMASVNSRTHLLRRKHKTKDLRELLKVLTEKSESNPSTTSTRSKKPISSKGINFLDYDNVIDTLGKYDTYATMKLMAEREALVYGVLKGQADRLREFDGLSPYLGLTLKDIDKLPIEEKKRLLTGMLEGKISQPSKKGFGRIEVITTQGIGELREMQFLLLPIYGEDSTKSRESLTSLVYDSLVMGFRGEGFDHRGENEANGLVRLDYVKGQRSSNIRDVQNKTNEYLKSQSNGAEIIIVEDIPLYSFCFNSK